MNRVTKSTDPVVIMPPEILTEIFQYLNPLEWLRLKLVSTSWNTHLTSNDHLWRGPLDLLDERKSRINEKRFEKCLQFAVNSHKENPKVLPYVSLTMDETIRGPEKFLDLLSKSSPIGNFTIQELNIVREHKFDAFSSTGPFYIEDALYNLTMIKKLTVFCTFLGLSPVLLAKSQPNMEYLKLTCHQVFTGSFDEDDNGISDDDEEEEMFQHLSLKWLEINLVEISRFPSINRTLKMCPNLEVFTLEYYESKYSNIKFNDIQQLFKILPTCKIRFLNLQIDVPTDLDRLPSTGTWPERLEYLVIYIFYWNDYRLVSGSLENLKHLEIGLGSCYEKFFIHYNVGLHLKSLHIDAIYFEDGIWKRCSGVEHLTISYIAECIDSFIEKIVQTYLPKLKTIDVPGSSITDGMLAILSDKKGLEKIGILYEHGNFNRLLSNRVEVVYNKVVNPYSTFKL